MSFPIIYPQNEMEFKTNGIGRLKTTSCKVTRARNSTYELEAKVPLGAEHLNDIEEKMILYSRYSESDARQPFRIYRISKPINGEVTINAAHVSYDMNKITVTSCEANDIQGALRKIKANVKGRDVFEFWTDKQTVAPFKIDAPRTLRAAISGQEGSILDVFGGGEIDYDHYKVKIYQNMGSDKGVTIRYGKNLSSMLHTLDNSNVFTACVPYYVDLNEEIHYCDGDGVVYSDWYDENTANDIAPILMNEFFDDESEGDEVWYPTSNQMREKALAYMTTNAIGIAEQNIEINFVQLWQTEEYANIAPLQKVDLCDEVSVIYPQGNIVVKAKVVRTVYDVLKERYEKMELGDAKSNISSTIKKSLQDAVSSAAKQAAANKVNKTQMQKAIEHATSLLTGAYGGHMVISYNAEGEPNEMFFMDTADTATAKNVLRINMNGIGFSSKGIDGPYATAWTLDGAFVADYITTGTLDASLVKTGILTDAEGKNSINMLTGEANFEALNIEAKRAEDAEKALGAQIQVNAEEISSKVTSAQAESLIDQKADSIRLKADKISWESTNSSMTEAGILTAKAAVLNEATVKGLMETDSGKYWCRMQGGLLKFGYTDNGFETIMGTIQTNFTVNSPMMIRSNGRNMQLYADGTMFLNAEDAVQFSGKIKVGAATGTAYYGHTENIKCGDHTLNFRNGILVGVDNIFDTI